MDRTGFNLIDEEYQRDLVAKKQEITDKWVQHFAGKKYVATPELNKQHKAKDQELCQRKIEKELAPYKEQFHDLHFPDKNRDQMLKEIEQKEKSRQVMKDIQQEFNRKASNDRGR